MNRFNARKYRTLSCALLFGAVTPLFSWGISSAEEASEILVKPGDDVGEIVEEAPKGATIRFAPGIYREAVLTPKDGQTLIGEPGAILNGALVLSDWRQRGDYWVAKGLPPSLKAHGMCFQTEPLCKYREDLFVDGTLYKRVDSRDDLGPGKWAFRNGRVYMSDNPDGKLIEYGVTEKAIIGKADNVTLKNLTVEKYASAAQMGAIHLRKTKGWVIENVVARWNHGVGIHLGSDTLVKGGSYSYNGQMGMGAASVSNVKVEGVELSHNNYARYGYRWEAGGSKFVNTKNLLITGTCVHNNYGPGLWTDMNNFDAVIDGNFVFDNVGEGIMHEVSGNAIIRNNKAARNGWRKSGWLWGSQILIHNSSDTEVTGNIVQPNPESGNGIGVIFQKRYEWKKDWYTDNNIVHNNTLILAGDKARAGIVADYSQNWFWRTAENRFYENTYMVTNPDRHFWGYKDRFRQWDTIRDQGQEEGSKLIVMDTPKAPMSFDCATDPLKR